MSYNTNIKVINLTNFVLKSRKEMHFIMININVPNKLKTIIVVFVVVILSINSAINVVSASNVKSIYVKSMKYTLKNWNCHWVASYLKKGFYTGYVKNEIPNGKGTFSVNTKEEGITYKWYYSGLWKDGRPNGNGVMDLGDGYKYSGQWKNGEMYGKCELVPGGDDGGTLKIIGIYKIDKFTGNATYYLINGDKIIGYDQKPSLIKGTYIYKNGNKFIGCIDSNGYMLQGYGTFIYKSGKKVKGIWKDGKYISAKGKK